MQIALKDKINRIYITSTDIDTLERAYKEITTAYLDNPMIKKFVKSNPEMEKEYGIYEALSRSRRVESRV